MDSVPDELLLRRIFGLMVLDGTPPGVGGTSLLWAGGWVTSESSDGRDRFRGRPMEGGAIANDGVFGGPGVNGVESLVVSDTSEPVDSIWSAAGMVFVLGRVRDNESRLGLLRFMLNTGGRVAGDGLLIPDEARAGEFMEMADNP